jgi:hypothetical protein
MSIHCILHEDPILPKGTNHGHRLSLLKEDGWSLLVVLDHLCKYHNLCITFPDILETDTKIPWKLPVILLLFFHVTLFGGTRISRNWNSPELVTLYVVVMSRTSGRERLFIVVVVFRSLVDTHSRIWRMIWRTTHLWSEDALLNMILNTNQGYGSNIEKILLSWLSQYKWSLSYFIVSNLWFYMS